MAGTAWSSPDRSALQSAGGPPGVGSPAGERGKQHLGACELICDCGLQSAAERVYPVLMLTDAQRTRLELQRIISHAERIAAAVKDGTELRFEEAAQIIEARIILQALVAR